MTVDKDRSKMTLKNWMVEERYPELKEEVGNSIPGCEISSLLDKITSRVVICLLSTIACRPSVSKKEMKKETVVKDFSSVRAT
jgi:hypothetical protein